MSSIINDLYKTHLAVNHDLTTILNDMGGISTSWSISKTKNNPGFFTPFEENMDLSEAAIALVGSPIIKSLSALSCLAFLCTAYPLFLAQSLLSDESSVRNSTTLAEGVTLLGITAYVAVSAVVDLIKETLALITRSIATIAALLANQLDNAFDAKEIYATTGLSSAR